ncbi:MAG: hypothetical protein C0626_02140 [Arcobacter sp.]|uniref:hypothetical protein n=1 Tax=uncultured Arcobacter sp. TaxID=165434 RepID=UPI000CA6D8CE|nr:hypothetical protein [uncultured Arcobacter sp.]PLY11392.1 MAG: hypothetical protein C0626_02140 [Arcobacter sp.]
MSNNSDTISKLSDALSNLINAYETLQKEKEELEKENQKLKNDIEDLDALNGDLNSKLNDINSTNEKQGSNINSMLSKIETILNVGDRKKETNQNEVAESSYSKETSLNIEEEEEFLTTPVVSSDTFAKPKAEAVKVDDIQLEKKSDEKIDLNRMASLLNGFNNK